MKIVRQQNNRNVRAKVVAKGAVIKKKPAIRTPVKDARQKIIQNKRANVADARDVLAKMAKTQDARSKLNKIRAGGLVPTRPGANVKVIGQNIVQKTDRNGKISLSTNKPKPKADMNLAIKKQLGLVAQTPKSPAKKLALKRSPAKTNVSLKRSPASKVDLGPINARLQRIERLYEGSIYKWQNPNAVVRSSASQMIESLEPPRRFATSAWQPQPMRLSNRGGFVGLDDAVDVDMDDVQVLPPIRKTFSVQGTARLGSGIHSRLDGAPAESHGIFGKPKTKVVVPAGHRIVVSNLQPTVTQEDIKELFEDIGQLLTARLVRPGVAEVIYKNLKDAQKAVDTYHNRQLDGQPMKCLLVNKRPINHPTAPAFSGSQGLGGRSEDSKVVPDINTIHKVLFQRK